MINFLKFIFTLIGGLLIGFGLALLIDKSGAIAADYYDTAMALSLIAGGFFAALGIPARQTDKDILEQPSSPPHLNQ